MKKILLYTISVFILFATVVNASNSTNITNSTLPSTNISLNITINETINISSNTTSFNLTNNSTNTTPSSPTNSSSLEINQSKVEFINILNTDIYFGDEINITLGIYKGNTRKYVVKAWVEDISNVSKRKVYGKYLNATLNFSLKIENNSECNHESGNYILFVEGIDASMNRSIYIKKNCSVEEPVQDAEEVEEEEDIEEETPKISRKVIFYITEFPKEIVVNESFRAEIKFLGNNEKNEVEIFSYVYKSSKSYSGDREENKESFVLKPDENRTIRLDNKILKFGEDLRFKIKVRFNERKTYDEITREVNVEEPTKTPNEEPKENKNREVEEVEESIEVLAEQKIFQGIDEPYVVNLDDNTVYRSKSVRSLDIALYSIICVLVVLLSYILFKKDF